MYLPLSLSDILAANLAGVSVMLLDYYNPFLLSGTALKSVGIGLFTTFTVSTDHEHWIPYQVIYVLGAGMTVTMPVIAVQTVLKREQVPVGTAIIMLFQFFGGSVFLAISQSVFSNELVDSLTKLALNSSEIQDIINAGSAAVREVVTAQQLPGVLNAYNTRITSAFYVATAACACAFLAAFGLEWRSVKGKSLVPGGA